MKTFKDLTENRHSGFIEGQGSAGEARDFARNYLNKLEGARIILDEVEELLCSEKITKEYSTDVIAQTSERNGISFKFLFSSSQETPIACEVVENE